MKYKVNTKRLKLRIRKSPSAKSRVVGYMAKGSIIEVVSISNGWAKVSNGYVKASLIKKVDENVVTPTATTEEVETKPTTKSNADKLAECAYNFAYKTNDSKAKYPSGKPLNAYKEAFNKAYPTHNKWKYKSHRVGANCGAFVGTCVRSAGIDKDFPHTSQASYKYLENTEKWEQIPLDGKLENGDIIIYHKGSDGHICIHYDGQIKEANYNGFYPKTTNSLKSRLSTNGKTKVRVYRARG